jgi:pyruvate dehydrogenase (quinone)
LQGIRVHLPDQVGPSWDAYLFFYVTASNEIYTDPDVPPLPPHISFKQARAYAESLLKGDADAAGTIRSALKELFA